MVTLPMSNLIPSTRTGTADARAIRLTVNVLGRVFVSLWAVCLRCVERRYRRASHQVLVVRHALKMVEPEAVPDSADVVNFHAIGNQPIFDFPCNAVNAEKPTPNLNHAVPLAVPLSGPQPASFGSIRFGSQSLFSCADIPCRPSQWISIEALMPEVSGTKPDLAGNRHPYAIINTTRTDSRHDPFYRNGGGRST